MSAALDPAELGSLAALDALLSEGSVSGAARRLGLSTPATSHALARLRERFGDPLLVRAGRRMVLTPRAEALRPQVAAALEAARRVFEAPASLELARLEQSFTISVTDYVLLIFGEALDEALGAAPGVTLRAIPNAVDDPERLRRGETDLAVGIYGALPPELRTRPIITDRLVCVARAGHPAVGEVLTLEAFTSLDHVQVAPRGQPGGYVDEVLASRGLRRRVTRAVPYFHVALEWVAGSDRLLTVSERIARRAAPGLGLRVLEPPLELEPFALSMVWHPRLDSDPGHRWLRERLVEVTQAQEAMAHPGSRRRLSRSDPAGWRPG